MNRQLLDLCNQLYQAGVFQFGGEWSLKSGRTSPYFVNTGKISDSKLLQLIAVQMYNLVFNPDTNPYAFRGIRKDGNEKVDVFCGIPYKGIPLAIALSQVSDAQSNPIRYNFMRKEEKRTGEKGRVIGAEVSKASILLIDDVLTAGTGFRQACKVIESLGGKVIGVLVLFDRQESVVKVETDTTLTLLRDSYPIASALLDVDMLITYLRTKTDPRNYEYLKQLIRHKNS